MYSKFEKNKLIKIATFVVLFLLSIQIISFPKYTLAAVLSKPFGGVIISYVPSTPLCPVPHTLIYDFKTRLSFGIAVLPSSVVYAYANLFKPGTFVLGKAGTVSITCALPYLIYPIIQVGTSK